MLDGGIAMETRPSIEPAKPLEQAEPVNFTPLPKYGEPTVTPPPRYENPTLSGADGKSPEAEALMQQIQEEILKGPKQNGVEAAISQESENLEHPKKKSIWNWSGEDVKIFFEKIKDFFRNLFR